MAEAETEVGHASLTKFAALQYMEHQGKPITAKELAVDLDSRASTASELLERMTSQGLVERDQDERPREYTLTDAGRERLKFFQSREHNLQRPSNSDSSARASGETDGSARPIAEASSGEVVCPVCRSRIAGDSRRIIERGPGLDRAEAAVVKAQAEMEKLRTENSSLKQRLEEAGKTPETRLAEAIEQLKRENKTLRERIEALGAKPQSHGGYHFILHSLERERDSLAEHNEMLRQQMEKLERARRQIVESKSELVRNLNPDQREKVREVLSRGRRGFVFKRD